MLMKCDNDQKEQNMVNAINVIFCLFEDCYPLQFMKAYPTNQDILRTKRIYKKLLFEDGFNSQTVVKASKEICKKQKYFPNFHDIYSRCEQIENDERQETEDSEDNQPD